MDRENGLKKNENSPFYGRFRLAFNQVYPFREPTYNRVLVKIKEEFVHNAKSIYELLPGYINGLFNIHQQKDIKKNRYIQIYCFEDEDYILELNMLSDVKYLAMENFYFALLELAPFLENFKFFIYSTGDGDDRWLDEYTNDSGQLTCNRSICQSDIMYGRIIYYINCVNNKPKDMAFKLFTTWQIYDRLNFESNRRYFLDEKKEYRRNMKFINDCKNETVLNNYYINLNKMYKDFVLEERKDFVPEEKSVNVITKFKNWCSVCRV